MKKNNKIYFVLAPIFIFLSLLFGILSNKSGLPSGQLFSIIFGVLSFSFMLTDIIISLRLKLMENKVGLPKMYKFHAIAGILSFMSAIVHIGSQFQLKNGLLKVSPTLMSGFIIMFILVLTVLTGAISLSSIFSNKIKFINNIKKNKLNREKALIVHKLSVLATTLIFFHILTIEFIRGNNLFVSLSFVYIVAMLFLYFKVKIKRRKSKEYYLIKKYNQTDDVLELEFRSKDKKIFKYNAGQYVFIKFIKSKLPKESHPFSITSDYSNNKESFSLMVKKSGDYTNKLNLLNINDIALVEGPYGNFFDEESKVSKVPFVMLAGGIGITPILSIIRNEINNKSDREIVLVWGLTALKEIFLLDELEEMKKINKNFNYKIILSRDKSDKYDHGRINEEFLEKIKVDKLYDEATFFICGPSPMMDSMKTILKKNNVKNNKIKIEEFSF